MLGSLISNTGWVWAAVGKHPSAKDYLQLGVCSPVMKTLSEQVDKGYHKIADAKNIVNEHCSWLFWGRGFRRDEIMCGLLKTSCDGIGRPYPLLILGIGPLNEWEKNWDLVPMACDKVWSRAEYISAKHYEDIQQLEIDLVGLGCPMPEWSVNAASRNRICGTAGELCAEGEKGAERYGADLPENAECIICLDDEWRCSYFSMIHKWHFLVKERYKSAPNAIFMGGRPDKAYLAFFRRPLIPADFSRLLSAFSNGRTEKRNAASVEKT